MTAAGERGTTIVSDRAVRKIARRAAGEAEPILAGSAESSATVRGRRADVAVKVALPFPAPLPQTVRRIQAHVTHRTHELTGLHVGPTRVQVNGLLPVQASHTMTTPTAAHDAVPAHRGTCPRTPMRWWSPRRLPMALLTLTAATACGALAYDMALVHLAHRSPASWRTEVVSRLGRHGPDDAVVGIGAGTLAALGILMVFLAVSPGRRGLLTVVTSTAQVRAVVDRKAVALVVRDAVEDVPGISTARVRAGRRRLLVRAQLAFGERETARRDVAATARRALDGCGLRRPPTLRVRVRPDSTWACAEGRVGDGDQQQASGTAGVPQEQKDRAPDAP
ncbi:DUF6286 domain-containing Asp23/Gls24 family envelope stress response protein [Streptomyces sp. KL116D]|uniref:DUF6286 domain-containing Asp23/Gls24 family envelope stress response protein n=1 Tax=Streptomyces sp. KL116D TaxID=3045152 RepID=UPI003555F2F6